MNLSRLVGNGELHGAFDGFGAELVKRPFSVGAGNCVHEFFGELRRLS